MGRTWDSKMEMTYALQLEMQKKAGDIIDFCCQPLVILSGDVHYRPDFKVTTPTETFYVEIKGRETERFKVIKKLWAATQKLDLRVATLKAGAFVFYENV